MRTATPPEFKSATGVPRYRHDPGLTRAIAKRFPDRPYLNFSAFRNSVASVDDVFANNGCSIYNVSILTDNALETYIAAQKNLYLVPDTVIFGKHTHGAVIKDEFIRADGEVGYCYLLVVASKHQNHLMRRLTLAHELAHVFLHGRLLQPGMVFKRRYATWHSNECALRHQMEAEANIFSLIAFIPSAVIHEVRVLTKPSDDSVLLSLLTYVLSCLYGASIHSQLVRERLLIEDLFEIDQLSSRRQSSLATASRKTLAQVKTEFDALLDGPAWILNSTIDDDTITWSRPPLSVADLGRLCHRLLAKGVLSRAQTSAAVRHAVETGPNRTPPNELHVVVIEP